MILINLSLLLLHRTQSIISNSFLNFMHYQATKIILIHPFLCHSYPSPTSFTTFLFAFCLSTLVLCHLKNRWSHCLQYLYRFRRCPQSHCRTYCISRSGCWVFASLEEHLLVFRLVVMADLTGKKNLLKLIGDFLGIKM